MAKRGSVLATGIGWFSIGLGVSELFAASRVSAMIGVNGASRSHAVVRAMGLREIGHGVGILAKPRSAAWVGSRIGGDVLDLVLLGVALGSPRSQRSRIIAAVALVAGAAALDIFETVRLSRRAHN